MRPLNFFTTRARETVKILHLSRLLAAKGGKKIKKSPKKIPLNFLFGKFGKFGKKYAKKICRTNFLNGAKKSGLHAEPA